MADSFGLAGARLAHHDVPGEFVKALADGVELVESLLELLAKVIEAGPPRRIADAARCCQCILREIGSEGGLLFFAALLDDIGVDTQYDDQKEDADGDDQRQDRTKGKADANHRKGGQDVNRIPQPGRKINEGAEEREKLVHGDWLEPDKSMALNLSKGLLEAK